MSLQLTQAASAATHACGPLTGDGPHHAATVANAAAVRYAARHAANTVEGYKATIRHDEASRAHWLAAGEYLTKDDANSQKLFQLHAQAMKAHRAAAEAWKKVEPA